MIDTVPQKTASVRHTLARALPGLIQAAATFCPAARLRLWGTISFLQLHWLGGVVLVLGLGTAAAAVLRRPRWVLLGGVCTACIVTGMYVRIVRAPSRTIADHALRHLLHPAWGFWPMYTSIACSLIVAVWMRRDVIRCGETARTSVDASRSDG